MTPFTVTKVIQLYETKNSRHSTMIVGKTGSGKTVTWRILQNALSTMHRNGVPEFNLIRVRLLSKPYLSTFSGSIASCVAFYVV